MGHIIRYKSCQDFPPKGFGTMPQQSFMINLNDEFNATRTPRTLKKTSPHKKESPGSVRRRALLEQWRLKKRKEHKMKEMKKNTYGNPIAYNEETPVGPIKYIRTTGVVSPTFSSALKDRRKSNSPNYHGSCQICSRFSRKETDSDLSSQRKEKQNSPCIFIDRPGSSPSKNNLKSYVTLASENKFSKASLKICGKTEDNYVFNFKDSCVTTLSNLDKDRSKDLKCNRNTTSPANITAETTDIPNITCVGQGARTPSTLMKEANNVLETAKEMFENRNINSLPSVRTTPYRNSATKEKKGTEQKKSPKEMGYTASTSSSRKKERKIRDLQKYSSNAVSVNTHLGRNQINSEFAHSLNSKETGNMRSPKSPKDIAKARMKKMRTLMIQKHQGLANEIKELSDTVTDDEFKNEKMDKKDNKGRVSFATEDNIHNENSTTYESKSIYQHTLRSDAIPHSQSYNARQKLKATTPLRSILKKDKSSDSKYPKGLSTKSEKIKSISPKDTARARMKEMNKRMANQQEAIRAEKNSNSMSITNGLMLNETKINNKKTNKMELNGANESIKSSAQDVSKSKTTKNSLQTKSADNKPSAETMLRKLALSPINKLPNDFLQRNETVNSKSQNSTYTSHFQTFEETLSKEKKSVTIQTGSKSTWQTGSTKSKMRTSSAMASETQKKLCDAKANNASYSSSNSANNNIGLDFKLSSTALKIKNDNSSRKHTENHILHENEDILDETKIAKVDIDINPKTKILPRKVTIPSSIMISPIVKEDKYKLERKENIDQYILKDTNIKTNEHLKKAHKAAPQSLDYRHASVVVEDASESENDSINLPKQDDSGKPTLESYHLKTFQKSLERIKTQGLSSDEIIEEFCSNSQRVAKGLNEKHNLAKTQSLTNLECNTMIEQTNMLGDAIIILSKKTFETNEKLRAKKDDCIMLEKKNLSLMNDLAAYRRDFARMTSDLYAYQRNFSRRRYSMNDVTSQESKTENTIYTNDDTLPFSAKEYAKIVLNSNGVDTPKSSFKMKNRSNRASYMKGSFTISATEDITQHVNPMCEETKEYPGVPHTLGTAFVVDLCGHLNLDVGHHASLASIMDKQWDSSKKHSYGFKEMMNASF